MIRRAPKGATAPLLENAYCRGPGRALVLGLALSALAMILPAPASAQAPGAAEPQPPATRVTLVETEAALRGFDAFIQETMRQWQVPGVSIAIVRDGEVVLSRGYGVRDPAARAPVDEHTLFPIASIAKTFTSFGIGLLVDEGKADLDRPVSAYLPGFAVDDAIGTSQISLRDLMAHRSGLPAFNFTTFNAASLSRERLVEMLPHIGLSAPIRTRFDYSNGGYGIVGHTLEHLAGMPWERFMEARIFGPLGMTRSMARPNPQAEREANRIRGAIWWQGRYIPTDIQPISAMNSPAGGIYSTAHDMARWMRVHLARGRLGDRQIIQAETLQTLHRTAMVEEVYPPDRDYLSIGYGLGWFTDVYRGEPFLNHGGNDWGVSTELGLLPRLGLGITVLVNQDSSQYPTAIMRSVLDRFIGATGRDWSAEMLAHHRTRLRDKDGIPARQAADRIMGTQPGRPLSAYAGTYSHPGYGTFIVRLEGDRLSVEGAGERAPLIHWHHDVFAAASPNHMGVWSPEGWKSRLAFSADVRGRISELRIGTTPGLVFARQAD